MENKKNETLIKRGFWLYQNDTPMEVGIIKQNLDYYYEEGYSEGEPHLNSDGFAFYVVFDNQLEDGCYNSRSETLYTIQEALEYAEFKTKNTIKWL